MMEKNGKKKEQQSNKKNMGNEWNVSAVLFPFYKAADFLYRKLRKPFEKYFNRQKKKLKILAPAQKSEEQLRLFFVQKTALVLLVLVVGIVFLLLSQLSSADESILQNGNQLEREMQDGDSYTVNLDVQAGEDTLKDFEVTVAQRKYTDAELEQAMTEFIPELEKTFLGENESVDHVCHDLNLCSKVTGYPFKVEWQSDKTEIVNNDGEIYTTKVGSDTSDENVPDDSIPGEDKPDENEPDDSIPGEDKPDENEPGEVVILTATITYEDTEVEQTFPLMVYPKEQTSLQRLEETLQEAINQQNTSNRENQYLELPLEIDGMKIFWSEEKRNNTILFFLLLLAAAIGIFAGKDKDLSNQLEKRQEEMLQDYPEIVSKLTLFVGAGMSVRGAFTRIALEYKAKRKEGEKGRYAYEEMLYTVYEMESGVEESVAYQHFSARSKVQKYVKFGALLEQNLKMGGKGFLDRLNAESRDALEERKNRAERLGEQAGTKLLVPMFMMLLIVMVIIMVPAFMSM